MKFSTLKAEINIAFIIFKSCYFCCSLKHDLNTTCTIFSLCARVKGSSRRLNKVEHIHAWCSVELRELRTYLLQMRGHPCCRRWFCWTREWHSVSHLCSVSSDPANEINVDTKLFSSYSFWLALWHLQFFLGNIYLSLQNSCLSYIIFSPTCLSDWINMNCNNSRKKIVY
jgi:hypothetical protein